MVKLDKAILSIKITILVFGASILLTALPIFMDLIKPELKLIMEEMVASVLLLMGLLIIYLGLKIKTK